jgi:hypothetical protein
VVDFKGEADQDESSWACEMKGQDGAGFLKIKNTPPGWEEKLKNRSGEFTLLADSLLDGDELVLPENANVNAILAPRGAGNNNGNGRRLARVVGDKSVLVVRVIAQDFSTSSSVSDLSDNVFGTNGDPVNLKSQYEDCSYNKLRFNPTQDPRTTNGVYEVTISSFISRGNRRASKENVMDAVSSRLTAELGDLPSQFDHVMYCLPPQTSGSWIAYAYINSWLSVYNDNWCNYVSAQVHEVSLYIVVVSYRTVESIRPRSQSMMLMRSIWRIGKVSYLVAPALC